MILADKIIYLRKNSNWSQEELAQQLNVSRQSVSKWESGLSIPDLDKIIKLSQLFGVTTDYLIKDDIEDLPKADNYSQTEVIFDDNNIQTVNITLEQATEYMSLIKKLSTYISLAISMFIFSPIPVILLLSLSEKPNANITEDFAGGVGSALFIFIITIGVAILIVCGLKKNKWSFIKKSYLNLDYGVKGIVEKKKQEYENKYIAYLALGISLCIAAVIPLLFAVGFNPSDMTVIIFVNVLLLLISLGVYFIIKACTINSSYDKLLQVVDYTPQKKSWNKYISTISTIYWCSAAAIYLYISFTNSNWDKSWVLWPIAGVLYVVVINVIKLIVKRKK